MAAPPPAPFLETIKSWELDAKPPFLGSPTARKLGQSGSSSTHVLPEDVTQWAGEDFNINAPDLLISEHRLGAGSFGAVYEGYYRDQLVAIKFQRLPHDGPILENLRTELSLLKNLSHPNLVLFYGAAPIDGGADEAGVLMVMEFCRGGSLETVIDRVRVGDVSMEISWAVSRDRRGSAIAPNHQQIPALERRRRHHHHCRRHHHRRRRYHNHQTTATQLRFRWVKEMAYALRAMHAQSIIHRDVKSANVLLDDQWSTKLCDYGLAVSSTSPSRMLFSGYHALARSLAHAHTHAHTHAHSLSHAPTHPLTHSFTDPGTALDYLLQRHRLVHGTRGAIGRGGGRRNKREQNHLPTARYASRRPCTVDQPSPLTLVRLRGGHLRPRDDHR